MKLFAILLISVIWISSCAQLYETAASQHNDLTQAQTITMIQSTPTTIAQIDEASNLLRPCQTDYLATTNGLKIMLLFKLLASLIHMTSICLNRLILRYLCAPDAYALVYSLFAVLFLVIFGDIGMSLGVLYSNRNQVQPIRTISVVVLGALVFPIFNLLIGSLMLNDDILGVRPVCNSSSEITKDEESLMTMSGSLNGIIAAIMLTLWVDSRS